MDPLFQLPPDDLTGLEDDQLSALADELRERVQEVHAGRRDPEVVGDRTQTQVAEETEQAVLALERIDAELEGRAREDNKYDDRMAAAVARAGVEDLSAQDETPPDDTPPDDGDKTDGDQGDKTDGDEQTEGQTAAATKQTPSQQASGERRPLPAARRHKPVASEDVGFQLRVTQHAAGLGSPFQALTPLDRDTLGEFLTDIVQRNRVPHRQKAVVAHASYAYPLERRLTDGPDSYLTNSLKIREVLRPDNLTTDALVASGGLCAPLTPIYELQGIETAARPVRNALPSFQAVRGGVQVGATPSMGGDYEDAVGHVTAANNEAGGTFAVKNCLRIVCPDFDSVTVDSIYQCIEADNLASRAYPELMSRIASLVNAEQARLADSFLLDRIKALSTAVTEGQTSTGAIVSFMSAVYKAAAGIRSRNRMTEGAALQALIPAWVIDLLALDTTKAASQDNRSATRAAIETLMRNAGIVPNFYLDGPATGTGQVFAAQTAGALIDFPADIQWAIFPAGSFLHLDAGELQLGVVRDSSLNATNDFQVFSETWENVAFTGIESLWVTTAVCPSGTFAAGKDLSAIC